MLPVLLITAPLVLAATETSDPFRITDAERAACTLDAERLCAAAYPDERKLLLCLKTNKASLSASCLPVFEAGLKRRGL